MSNQHFKGEDGVHRVMVNATAQGATASALLKIPQSIIDNPADIKARTDFIAWLAQDCMKGFVTAAMETARIEGEKKLPDIVTALLAQIDAAVAEIRKQQFLTTKGKS